MEKYLQNFRYGDHLSLLAVATITGCSQQLPSISPETQQKSVGWLWRKRPAPSRNYTGVHSVKGLIRAMSGGALTVVDGNDDFLASIQIPPEALAENQVICLTYTGGDATESIFAETRFAPHGTQFLKPVKIRISYRDADLSRVNEGRIRVVLWNEGTQSWDCIGGEVLAAEKIVAGEIRHFSRYALAAE